MISSNSLILHRKKLGPREMKKLVQTQSSMVPDLGLTQEGCQSCAIS